VSAAITGQARAQAPEKLPVVATFSILADFARNVGGERIEVTALVGPNGDTHVYQPKPADAKELGAARLILVNGLGLEGWIDRLIKASGAKAPVVVAANGIKPQQMREEGRLAAATGDREGAAHAYRRYLTLRENAEPSLQPQVVKVRAELARIERERIE